MGTPVAPFILENQHTNWRSSHFTCKSENSINVDQVLQPKKSMLKKLEHS
jgi:hypothetical protein